MKKTLASLGVVIGMLLLAYLCLTAFDRNALAVDGNVYPGVPALGGDVRVNASSGALLTEGTNQDRVVSVAFTINVPATSCLMTDPNVGGITFPANTLSVTIIPRYGVTSAGYLRLGAAASATAGFQLQPGGYVGLRTTKALADTLRIIGDSNFLADVLVETPR